MNPLRAISASLNRTLSEDRWAAPHTFNIEGGPKYMNLLADDAALSGQWTLATYNNYHNIRNPGSAIKYEINPNFWLMDYIDQLSCLVISKDDMGTGFGGLSGTQWRTRYGWLPITKRHVIGCAHAFTHASGTWSVNTAQQIPTRIRWRGTDGETVDRIQLHQASGFEPSYGLPIKDISVAVLDSDLPETVYIPRIVPVNKRYRLSYTKINPTQDQLWTPDIELIALSQEWAENVPENPEESHRAMVHLLRKYRIPPHENNMQYSIYQGDSGTPMLTVVNGEIMFYGVIVGFGATSVSYMPNGDYLPSGMLWETYLNRLIEQADDNAIAMGRMAQRTGYTVTVAPSS